MDLFTAEDRRAAVGMSDMSAILGLSQFDSAADLWLKYTGRAPIADELGPVTPKRTPGLFFGPRMEPVISQAFESHMLDEYGRDVKLRRDGRQYEKKEHRTQCHLDYRIQGEDAGVEAKNPGTLWSGDWGEPMTDQIPEGYLAQVHGQMWHVDTLNTIYCARLVGHEFNVYKVDRDERWFDVFAKAVDEFWHYVDNDKAPPLDYTRRNITETLALLYPNCDGRVINFGEDEVALTRVLELAQKSRKLAAGGVDHARAQLRERMGTASYALMPNGKVWRRYHQPGSTYEVTREDAVDFRMIDRLPKAVAESIQ